MWNRFLQADIILQKVPFRSYFETSKIHQVVQQNI